MDKMRNVVITGVSTGIGWATAKCLLSKEFRVFGTVRKQEDADRLQAEFGSGFVPLLADVTDEETFGGRQRWLEKCLERNDWPVW